MRSLIAILISFVAAMATLVSASHLGHGAMEPPPQKAVAEPAARLTAAAWQCLPPPPDCPGLDALDMVCSTFGVAIHTSAIYTYRDGTW